MGHQSLCLWWEPKGSWFFQFQTHDTKTQIRKNKLLELLPQWTKCNEYLYTSLISEMTIFSKFWWGIKKFQYKVREEKYLLDSSSRSLASNSLLGGYLGKLDGSQGRGFVVKNWKRNFRVKKNTKMKYCKQKEC